MKFLVTGGCGFIGSHLVDALCAAGHTVRILDDLSTGTVAYKPPEVELVQADVADSEIVVEAMEGMQGCFHLAAVASVERGNLDWIGTHRTNLTGTITIFDAARRYNLPVVFASSAAVYGDNLKMPLTENHRPAPISAYGADKLGCELHGRVAALVHRVPNCGLRFFNVYGPRQDPRSPYSGVITIFGNRIIADQEIVINGDGYHSRDFIYVGDVVNGLILAMTRQFDSVNAHGVFNVCTGVETNILDLANHIGHVLGRRPLIKFGPPRIGDPRTSIGDPAKTERVLGFRATINIETGLDRTFNR